ncbi:MAG: pirin family protein [Thermoanaerobaculia bacterium]
MLEVRRREERGHFDHGWLDTWHTFSFADYYDPRYMGFRVLRVLNEDRVAPGKGFPPHAHRDMEIVTYVLQGGLEHRDSMGTGSVIRPGDLQRMSAGRGVTHSEFNVSQEEPVHFLQIWILPERSRIDPGYEQKTFPRDDRRGRLRLVASRDGRDGSLELHQDLSLYAAILEPGSPVRLEISPKRFGWIQVARGEITANGVTLRESDGAAWAEESAIELVAPTESEVLVFDLP